MTDLLMFRWAGHNFGDIGIKFLKAKNTLVFLVLLTAMSLTTACEQKKTAGYFDQAPPGTNVMKFAPEIVSLPDRGEYSISFSKDGSQCYFDGYSGSRSGNPPKIYYAELTSNAWSVPAEIPDFKDQNFTFYSLSADGSGVYLGKNNKVWKSIKADGIWGNPEPLLIPTDSAFGNYGASESSDGVICFSSNRTEGKDNSLEIWRFSPTTGAIENLGAVINANIRNITPCISLDGSYLIYSQSDTNYEHLFISFNKGNNEWSEPINMDESGVKINIGTYQNSPSISPDGKYLFFNSHNSEDERLSDIYWVSTEVIDILRVKVLGK